VARAGSYGSIEEAIAAYSHGGVSLHAETLVRFPRPGTPKGCIYEFTSVGRLLFSQVLPPEIDFLEFGNEVLGKKQLGRLVAAAHERCGSRRTAEMLDKIKNLGFQFAKAGGISICLEDMRIPPKKVEILERARADVDRVWKQFGTGSVTDEERYQNIIKIWTHATDMVSQELMETLAQDQGGFNPIYIMAHSGARGNKDQIRQLAGMRGLMQRPTKKLTGAIGEIIE